MISPGSVDPDAEQVDVDASESHVEKLKAAAGELSELLCGDISIIDVQRGDNQRQAFHDRFLVLIGHDDVPTAYLFSNSMSKAAGDWPFTICELDQVTSHRVKAYVEDLLKGVDGNRTVAPLQSGEHGYVLGTVSAETPQDAVDAPAPNRPAWMPIAEAFLAELFHEATRTTDGKAIGEAMDAFYCDGLPAWISDVLAQKLVEAVLHREQNLVALSSSLGRGTDEQRDVASRIDEILRSMFWTSCRTAATRNQIGCVSATATSCSAIWRGQSRESQMPRISCWIG